MNPVPNQITEHRCADCLAEAESYWDDARWISQAGAVLNNPEIVVDLLAATLWQDVAVLHDEGSR